MRRYGLIYRHNTTSMLARNMVSNLIFRFRRSDVDLRNEWFNYTNWSWENKIPYDISRNPNSNITEPNTYILV